MVTAISARFPSQLRRTTLVETGDFVLIEKSNEAGVEVRYILGEELKPLSGRLPTWQPDTQYIINEAVVYEGLIYRSLINFISSDTFNPANWEQLGSEEVDVPVVSVFNRTGAVRAEAGDYQSEQVTFNNNTTGDLVSSTSQQAIDELTPPQTTTPPTNSRPIQWWQDTETNELFVRINGTLVQQSLKAGIQSEVASVFGRIGNVLAETDDYNARQVNNNSNVLGANVGEALDHHETRIDELEGISTPLVPRGGWEVDTNTVVGDPLNTELVKGQAPNADGGDPGGFTYIVTVGGEFDLTDAPGPETWAEGDFALWAGSAWVKISSNAVVSVFGRTGAVEAWIGDYTADQVLSTNGDVQTDLTALEATDTAQDGRLDTLETNEGVQDGRLDTLEADVQDTKIDEIRYSKLDNPITHLFKKNKLVDTLQGELSWQRDSAATYVDRYGVVRYSPSNVGENELLWSEDFSQAAWSPTRASINSDVAIAPDGTITVDKLVEDTSNGTHILFQDTPNTESGANVTISAFLKAGERSEILLQGRYASVWDVQPQAVFDLLNGTVAVIEGSGNIKPIGNGWYRCSITGKFGPTIETGGVTFSILKDGFQSYQGDGISGIYIWGAQAEISPVANAYVRTTDDPKAGIQTGFGIDQSREELAGWLIEGESTNEVLYSGELDNPAWNQNGDCTLETGFEAPDLTNTAVRVLNADESGNTQGSNNLRSNLAPTEPGSIYTGSAWIKKESTEGVTLRIIGGGTNNDITLGAESPIGEWIRVQVTSTADNTNGTRLLFWSENGVPFQATFGQIESLPFASSYIPTTDAAVTRAADDVTFPVLGNMVGPDMPFSLAMQTSIIGRIDGVQEFIRHVESIDDVRMFRSTSNQSIRVRVGAATENADLPDITPNESLLTAISSDGSDFVFIRGDNADSGLDDRTLIPPDGLPWYVGQGFNNDNQLYGHIQDLRIYDIELNDSELKFLAGK